MGHTCHEKRGCFIAEEKMKILHLMRLLMEETDDTHYLSAAQLCARIQEEHGLACE